MTIRKRLMYAVLAASVLVAVAAGSATCALYGASRYIQSVRLTSLPAVTQASLVVVRAQDLSQSLGDMVDSRQEGNALEHEQTNSLLPSKFDALDLALTTLQQQDSRSTAVSTNAVAQMRHQAAEMRANWLACRAIGVGDPDWPRALQLDDDAVAFVRSALAVQNDAVRQISDHLGDAGFFIKWVIYSSLMLTTLLVGVAVIAGIIFAGRLAARLGRVRGQAESIGAGDLSASLEVVGADEIDQIAVTFNDMVKALRSSRQQLEHDSLHDSLTELPNRALLKERLGRRFLEAKRHNDYGFAVLFLDLDHFKLVNDSLGHAAGDELLRVVAARLQQVALDHGLRTDGENTLSRLGGDEFTLLLDHVNGVDDAVTVAKSIKSSLALPMQIEGTELTITSSVGVVVASAQTVDAKMLMSEADAALYRAKDDGRNGYAIFDSSMRDEVIQRLTLENNLRRALERKEFVLHFQPIFDLASGRLAGFEALIRWAQGGELVRPDLFIPIAEETGQIVEIGEWVIEEACAQFQQWHGTYGGPAMLTLNVSRRQLIDPNLVPHLRRVLAKTSLPPSSLVVEITESVLSDAAATFETLTAIRALGVLIYIDDFGTGYSTLSSLHRLPIDGIKIDKSFVKKGDVEGNQRTVLNTVVQLAHSLDIPVVAEGIETPDQLAMFQGISCDHGQGFHFAKPLTSADAERLLAAPAVSKAQAA